MKGYGGKILRIDLSAGDIRQEALDVDFARTFLGGNGFAAQIIYETVPATAEPLSDENAVVFAPGPLNNASIWGTGRGHVAAISPLTGYFADSNFGGDFAAMLKKTGFDAVVITGKSASPCYVLIDNDTVSIKHAEAVWGQTVDDAYHWFMEVEGADVESATIGPAGENLVAYANIMCSGKRMSAAGRGGLGAVLGSKQCKAIVVRGNRSVELADPAGLKACLKDRLPILQENTKALTNQGTPVLVNMINALGRLVTRNNTTEEFPRAHAISGEVIEEQYKQKNIACTRCPVACGKLVQVPHGEFAGQAVKMPEYETLFSLGSILENADLISIFNANAMCDQMGLDTISMGVTLAFAAECLEQGIVSAEEFGGTFNFGDSPELAEFARKTALQEGPGKWLALGSEALARRWGQESWKLLYSVQGMEIAGHSARGIRSMGLAYATSTRGGSHHDARPNYIEPDGDPGFEGQAQYCVQSQHRTAFGDSLVMCRFVMERGFDSPFDADMQTVLQAVTGWQMDAAELEAIGERVYNLERLINVRRGLSRRQDTLPYRVTHEPIPTGASQGRYCPKDTLQALLDEYYQVRGWDAQGQPTPEKLAALRLII